MQSENVSTNFKEILISKHMSGKFVVNKNDQNKLISLWKFREKSEIKDKDMDIGDNHEDILKPLCESRH